MVSRSYNIFATVCLWIVYLVPESPALTDKNDFKNHFLADEELAPSDNITFDELGPNKYLSYNEILKYIEDAGNEQKGLFRINKIGTTYENRDIILVRASSNFFAEKPIILVDGGVHAREWASISAMLFLIEDIKRNTSNLLQNADWYIIPVANPDGYEFTRNFERKWRKNRSRHNNSKCVGTDVNRNFGFHWGESGVSTNPCDYEIYAGPHAFSEVESRTLATVMKTFKKRIMVYISTHSYGNYMVYPYGYSPNVLPDNWRIMDFVAKNVTGEIDKYNGHVYKVMSAGQWYPGAGGSDDYAHGEMGIPLSYTVELTDSFGFEYPEDLLPLLAGETRVLFKSVATVIGNGLIELLSLANNDT